MVDAVLWAESSTQCNVFAFAKLNKSSRRAVFQTDWENHSVLGVSGGFLRSKATKQCNDFN